MPLHDDTGHITRLPDLRFFKGDIIQIPFVWMYNETEFINLSGSEVRFYLFPYGLYTMPVLFDGLPYKVAAIGNAALGECIVTLQPRHTQELESNKYSYQPVLLFNADVTRQYIRGEGDIIFSNSYQS